MSLEGYTIAITGASRGIGLQLAKELEKAHTNLILIARNTDNIDVDAKHLRINADLTNNHDLDRVAKQLQINNIDGIIHSAGIGIYKPIEELSEEEFDYSLKVNVYAPFSLTKVLLPQLEKSELALVMALGSGAGVMPFKNRSAYCTSKFALRGMMLSLAEEFVQRKTSFCLITLGSTITTFAGKSIEQQEDDYKNNGKATFPVEWVAKKLVDIIKDPGRDTEITLYPSEYGFGTWQKPK